MQSTIATLLALLEAQVAGDRRCSGRRLHGCAAGVLRRGRSLRCGAGCLRRRPRPGPAWLHRTAGTGDGGDRRPRPRGRGPAGLGLRSSYCNTRQRARGAGCPPRVGDRPLDGPARTQRVRTAPIGRGMLIGRRHLHGRRSPPDGRDPSARWGSTEAMVWAQRLAALAPLTMAAHKHGLESRRWAATTARPVRTTPPRGAWASADAEEGRTAFLEKRFAPSSAASNRTEPFA